MANAKLMKVMEYLINEQEDKAQELLHQIFIEKARAIHEEMMSHDHDMEEDMLGGDQGEHLADEIDSDQDEIDAEEHYAPMEGMDDDTDVDVDDLGDELEVDDIEDVDDMDADDADDHMGDEDEEIEVDMDDEHDMDMDSEHEEGDEERIADLEAAIEELKAEFEALKHEESGEQEHHDEMDADTEVEEAWESDMDESMAEAVKDVGSYQGKAKYKHTNGNTVTMEDGKWQAHDKKGRMYASGTYEEEDGGAVFFTDPRTADATGVDEISAGIPVSDWSKAANEILGTLYSSYSNHKDMMENVDLQAVHAAKGGEVGSGKFARAETNTKSPVPTSQKDTMGAKPVVTGKGAKHTGYDLQGAPSSDSMGAKANRRKATDGMSAVSKEGNSKALLNKDRSEGFGAGNPKSPISGRVR